MVQELWIHPRYPSLRGLLSFIPRSQEFPNAETLVFKSSESTIIDELRSVVWPEGKYPLPSTLVLYIPCWTFVDFYKFAEVLRRHHANLRKVRVRAMVWVDREAVVKVLGDIAKDNETLALWMALTSTPTLGVWNYRRSAQWAGPRGGYGIAEFPCSTCTAIRSGRPFRIRCLPTLRYSPINASRYSPSVSLTARRAKRVLSVIDGDLGWASGNL